jgi:peptidoglycan-associated lipoprotein
MKIARPVTLITVALMTLSFGFTGCKKSPAKTTSLLGPGPGKGIVGDERSGPSIGSAPAQSDHLPAITEATAAAPTSLQTGEGLKQPNGDFAGWIEDVSEFQDQTVYFEYDKANVKPGEIDKLKEVARRMKSSFQGKALRIEGHCDERGTEEYNRTLGDRRAQAIRELLAAEGVNPGMMPTLTFGEDKPADPGHNEAAFSKNRRGALVLLSPPSNSRAQLTTGLGESSAPRNPE